MLGFLEKLVQRVTAWADKMAAAAEAARKKKQPVPEPTLAVGDFVFHPLRNEPTPVLAVGERIWQFTLVDDKDKPDAVVHEVIEGSPEFTLLKSMPSLFAGDFVRTELSAEIDNTDDIERRTLVVALAALRKASGEEIAEHDRARISRMPESDEVVELPEDFKLDLDDCEAAPEQERQLEVVS